MPRRALVLGGGGPVGIAWEVGLAAGLAEEGIDIAGADLIIGTSAGSSVGAQLALGRRATDMLARLRAQLAAPATASVPRQEPAAPPDLAPLMSFMLRAATAEGSTEELRVEIGAFALQAQTVPEESFIAGFGTTLGEADWPTRAFTCTAVDTADGKLVTWDNESHVPLVRAVASSCSVPGIFPPITINGRRYMDGGMRSATNIDLACGYDVVLAVVVQGATPTETPDSILEIRRQRLEAELQAVRAAGGKVELIASDEASAEAFGINLMDASRRGPAAETGYIQGRQEAKRLAPFWG